MRQKLLIFFLPLVIYANTKVYGSISYSRSLDGWRNGVSHPAHQVPKPVPNPSLIRNLEPIPEPSEITTEVVTEPPKAYIPQSFNLPRRNSVVGTTISPITLEGSTEQPNASPTKILPAHVRPPLLPRPIPEPKLIVPASDSPALIPDTTVSITIEETTNGPIETQPSIEPAVIRDDDSDLTGYICARAEGYFRYPDRCDYFIECRDNTAISYKCPEGLHFNPSKIWPGYPCAYPFEVECHINTDNTVSFIVTTASPEVTETVENKEEGVLIGYTCAQADGYFGYPNECESFVECRNNLAIRNVCPNGLLFNPNIIWPEYPCVNPSEVQCKIVPEPTIPDEHNIVKVSTELPEPSTYAPYPASTSRLPFYPRPQPTRLPLRPEPNRESISTVRPPNEEHGLPEYSCAHADGYFGFPDICDSFIECRDNKGIRYLCPDDLYYNPNSVWPEYPCASPSEVQCGIIADPTVSVVSSTHASTPDVTESITIPTTHWPVHPRPQPTRAPLRPEPNREPSYRPPTRQPLVPWPTSTFRPPLTQKPLPLVTSRPHVNGKILPLQPPFVADDGQVLTNYRCVYTDGYFGFPDKCDSFIECRKNIAIKYLCPDGLNFNPNSVWPEYPCASPSEVQCGIIADPTESIITSTLTPTRDVTESITVSTRWPIYPRPQPTRAPFHPEPNWEQSSTFRPPTRQPILPWYTSTHQPPVSKEPLPIVTSAPNPNINHPPIIANDGEMLSGYRCARAFGYFRYNNECDSFVECKNNVAVKYICPDGLYFNPNTIWLEYPCAYPSEVQCENNAQKQVPQPTADCPHLHGYFPMNDGECGRYIMCQEGVATIMNCPQGLVFSPDTSSCDWPENVPSCNPNVFHGFTCPAPALSDNGEPSDELIKFRYGESCNQYIACRRGHPRLLSCDPGFSFDITKQACVSSRYVQNCKA